MPFAGYADHDDCVSSNQQASDPDAYCATIAAAVEGKDTAWMDESKWHNDRILETYLNSGAEDLEGERFPLEGQIAAMPFFMKYGFYEWFHGKDTGGTPVPIGKPIAWRIKDGKVEGRFGIFDKDDVQGHKWIDERWDIIQRNGKKGTSSLTFAAVDGKIPVTDERFHTVLEIPKGWMWSAAWVGPYAAAPESTVNYVSQSKAAMDAGLIPTMKAAYIPPTGDEITPPDFINTTTNVEPGEITTPEDAG